MAIVLDSLPVRQKKKKCNEGDKDSGFGKAVRAWPEGIFQGDSRDGHLVGDEGRIVGSHHSGEMMKEDPCNVVANTVHPETKCTPE